MSDKALSACPFCGKSVAKVSTASELHEEDFYEHSEAYAVICDASAPNGPGGCGASGGFFLTEAEAIAAWKRRAPEVPGGWKLVPIVLTLEMRKAWDSAPFNEDDDVEMREAYRRMIAAAPQPPKDTE